MNFFFCVLTVGFCLASAAAGPFSTLNLFTKNFGISEVFNLAPHVQQCPAIGTLAAFVVADAAGKTCQAEPCNMEKGKDYVLIYLIICGASEVAYKLQPSINNEPKTPKLPIKADLCALPGDVTQISFSFGFPATAIDGVYSVQLRVLGVLSSGTRDESCILVNFNVITPSM